MEKAQIACAFYSEANEDMEDELEIEIPISDEKQEEVEVKQELVRTKLNSHINLIRCFWCRNSFSGKIYSIPTKYIPSHYPVPNGTAETKSFVEKEVTRAERKMMEEEGTPVTMGETFELDGVFCSGECRQAYLEEHIQEPIYRDSVALLRMYDRVGYVPAMSWRLLRTYGGLYDIEEFRQINASKKPQLRENVINIGERYLERDYI
jgi:hypothetical protein